MKHFENDATNHYEYSLCSLCENFWKDSTSKVHINMD